MTNVVDPPVAPPPLIQTLAHDYAQKALTTAAVALAAHGLITTNEEGQVVSYGLGVAAYVVSIAWTYLAARFRRARLAAAIAAPAVK